MSRHCTEFDICGLPPDTREDGKAYCWLHAPRTNKPAEAFQEQLSRLLAQEHCDFRNIVVPAGHPIKIPEIEFPRLLNFSGASLPENALIKLERCTLRQGFQAHIKGGFGAGYIDILRSWVDGTVSIGVAAGLARVSFEDSRLAESGSISITGKVQTVLFRRSHFANTVTLRVTASGVDFSEATIYGDLDLSNSPEIGDLNLLETRWGDASVLNLSGALLRGRFDLKGPKPPKTLYLNGTKFRGEVNIHPEFTGPRVEVKASRQRPDIDGKANFSHVSLRSCLLVGNNISNMAFEDVDWPVWRGRELLFDERELRIGSRNDLTLVRLREAYETLKQYYQQRGNNRLAAEFHYGELEMRRHAQSNIASIASLEFLYWLLSGYGTRPARAFAAFSVIVLLGAFGYWSTGAISLSDALPLSLAAATFQRPDLQRYGHTAFRWIAAIQGASGPAVIALFALALRMRLGQRG